MVASTEGQRPFHDNSPFTLGLASESRGLPSEAGLLSCVEPGRIEFNSADILVPPASLLPAEDTKPGVLL